MPATGACSVSASSTRSAIPFGVRAARCAITSGVWAFTGGRLPPKSAILQIRINQNPYSAEFDTLGAGRIEIITKPGSQTAHGRFLFDVNGSALNARNPFLSQKPPHHSGFLGGTVSGPLGPIASLVVDGEMQHSP